MRCCLTRGLVSLLATGAAPLASALGQAPIISFEKAEGGLQLAGGPVSKPQILVSSDDYWGVIRAAGDLAVDFGRVTGTNFSLSNGEAGAEPAAYEYRPITNNYTVVSQVSLFYRCPSLARESLGLTRRLFSIQ